MDTAKFISDLVLSGLDKQIELIKDHENIKLIHTNGAIYSIEITGKTHTYNIRISKADGPSVVTVRPTYSTDYLADDTGAKFIAVQYDISNCLVVRLADFFNSLPGINTMIPVVKHLEDYNVAYCKQPAKDKSSPETWLTPTYNMKIKALSEQHAVVIAQASYIEHNMSTIISDNLDIFKWSWKAEKILSTTPELNLRSL